MSQRVDGSRRSVVCNNGAATRTLAGGPLRENVRLHPSGSNSSTRPFGDSHCPELVAAKQPSKRLGRLRDEASGVLRAKKHVGQRWLTTVVKLRKMQP
jgi:hypothetical protein